MVNYSNGKRGKVLATGTKTSSPVPYAKALKTFIALVNSKKNGDSHYQECGSSMEYQSSVVSPDSNGTKALFGIFPQHPTPINEAQLDRLLRDDSWGLQQKANGENRLLRVSETIFEGGNKKGQMCPVPMPWVSEFRQLGSFVANGEHVGDTFMAFDLLELNGKNLCSLPQKHRYEKLVELLKGKEYLVPNFKILECYYDTERKRALLDHVKTNNLEGVVTKYAHAPYEAGKGENSLKFVINEVATCIVTGINVQRSVQIGLLNDKGEIEPCGNVTIPVNRPIPKIDDHVDVQFMYRTASGSFTIPVYDPDNRGHRSDVDRAECSTSQVTRFEPVSEEIDHTVIQSKRMRP